MTTASKCACGESLEGYAPSGEGIVQCDKCGKRYRVQRSATQSPTLTLSTTVEVSEPRGQRMDRVAWIAAGIAGGVLIAMMLVFAVEQQRRSTAGVDPTISTPARQDTETSASPDEVELEILRQNGEILGIDNEPAIEKPVARKPAQAGDSKSDVSKTHKSGTAAKGTDRLGDADAQPNPRIIRQELSAEEIYTIASRCLVTIRAKNSSGERISSGSGFVLDSGAMERLYPDDEYMMRETFAKASAEAEYKYSAPYSVSAPRDVTDLQFGAAYIVTNFHVIEAAVSLEFSFASGEATRGGEFSTDVIAESQNRDIAILKVLGHSFAPGLRVAEIHAPIGQVVYALGNPQGLEGSLSDGIVSGYRDLDDLGRVIQTTAAISHGSSGGPLLDKYGDVIGVMTAVITSGQNLNLAVPAEAIEDAFSSGLCEREVSQGRSTRDELQRYLIGKMVQCEAVNEIRSTGKSEATEIANEDESIQNAKAQLILAIKAHLASKWNDAKRFARQAEPPLPDDLKPAAWIVEAIALFDIAQKHVESKVSPGGDERSSKDVDRIRSLLSLDEDYQKSLGLLRRAIRSQPEMGSFHRQLAYQLGQAGEYLGAKNAYDAAIRYCPYDAILYWSRGTTQGQR